MRNFLLLSIILLLTFSCGDNTKDGPDDIYYGEDICERCKMIISDKKFAAQYREKNGNTVKFDDTGCMIEHIINNENVNDGSVDIYVVDYDTGQWIDGKEAYYIWTEEIKTPMGYGIVAFRDRNSAGKFRKNREATFVGSYTEVKKFTSGGLGNPE